MLMGVSLEPNDSFLQGNTANYIDEMYMSWKKDPSSVHLSWQVYFRNMEDGNMPMSQAFQPPQRSSQALQVAYPKRCPVQVSRRAKDRT